MIHPVKALRRWLRRFLNDPWPAIMRAFARSLPTDNPATLDQMKANKGWAFAANRQIAGRAVRVVPTLFLNTRSGPDGAVTKKPVFDHPLLDLMAQPNCDESGTEYHWRRIVQLNTSGRCFTKVVPEVTDLSIIGLPYTLTVIRELRLLDPDRVRPIYYRNPETGRERFGAGYEFTPYEGGITTYLGAPFDRASREKWKANPYVFVYPVRMPSAESIHGQSPMQAAEHPANVIEQLGKMHFNQLQKGLHSDLIFYLLRDVDDPIRFREAVLMVMTGVAKAGEPMVVPKKLVEVAPSGRGNKDMEFVALAESMRQQLLGVLGASDGMVGLGGDLNRATVEGMERIFALGTIDPLNSLIAAADSTWLLPLFRGQNDDSWLSIEFGTSAGVDELTQTEILLKQTAGAAIKTQNEARKPLGLEPLPSGDELPKGSATQLPALVPNTAQLPMPKSTKSNGHGTVQLARCPRCRKVQKALDGTCCGVPLIPQDVVLFD